MNPRAEALTKIDAKKAEAIRQIWATWHTERVQALKDFGPAFALDQSVLTLDGRVGLVKHIYLDTDNGNYVYDVERKGLGASGLAVTSKHEESELEHTDKVYRKPAGQVQRKPKLDPLALLAQAVEALEGTNLKVY